MSYKFRVSKDLVHSNTTPETCLNLVMMEAANFEYPVSYRLSHIYNLLEAYNNEKVKPQKKGTNKEE